MKQVIQLMQKGFEDHVYPGAVLLVVKENKTVLFEAFGFSDIFSHVKMTKNTIFDLASLTKPLATTLAVMKIIENGLLEMDQELRTILPAFNATEKGKIKIRNLLAHNSGLPDYRPYFRVLCQISRDRRKDALQKLLLKEPLLLPIGEKVIYSDIGFMILKWMIETVTKNPMDQFLNREIYIPQGLLDLFFVHGVKKDKNRVFAATEFCPWRDMLLKGQVHDENAFVMGGVAGHAGLFGNASGIKNLLLKLLSDFLGKSKTSIFQRQIIQLFFRRHKDVDRALGFDSPSHLGSSSGRYLSKESVGHLGFTGTSFWMDTKKSIIIILLTNRVHPNRNNNKIKVFRPLIHDAIMNSLYKRRTGKP